MEAHHRVGGQTYIGRHTRKARSNLEWEDHGRGKAEDRVRD